MKINIFIVLRLSQKESNLYENVMNFELNYYWLFVEISSFYNIIIFGLTTISN